MSVKFGADETAMDLFRRIKFPQVNLGTCFGKQNKNVSIGLGDMIEIQAKYYEVSDVVLAILFQFYESFKLGRALHFSTGEKFKRFVNIVTVL